MRFNRFVVTILTLLGCSKVSVCDSPWSSECTFSYEHCCTVRTVSCEELYGGVAVRTCDEQPCAAIVLHEDDIEDNLDTIEFDESIPWNELPADYQGQLDEGEYLVLKCSSIGHQMMSPGNMIGYCTPVEINNDGNGSPTNGGYQGCVPWDSVSCAATAKCVGCVWSNGQYMCESFDPLTTAEDEYPSEAPNTDVLCGNGAVEGYPDYVEPEQPDPESTDPEQPYPE